MFAHRAEIAGQLHRPAHAAGPGAPAGQAQPLRPQRQGARARAGVAAGQVDRSAAAITAPAVQRALQHVAAADEAGDERGGRALVQVFLRAGLLHPAVLHHHQAVGHRHRLVLVVRDHHRGQPARLLQQPDVAPHLAAQGGIQVGQRLVQQQQARVDRQRAGEGDALLLAAGKLPRQPVGQRLQPGQPQHLRHPGVQRRPLHAPHLQPEGDVAGDAQVREQRVGLEHQPEVALVRRQARMLRPSSRMSPAVAARSPRPCAGSWSCRSRTGRAARPSRPRRCPG